MSNHDYIGFNIKMSKLHDLIHERFLFSLVLLFILSSAVAFAIAPEPNMIVDIIIDIFGVVIGIMSIFLILHVVKSFKGSLRKSFNYIIYGIAFQILALIEHSLRDLGLSLVPQVDLHPILMVTGIVFFTIAVFKLRNMIKELK